MTDNQEKETGTSLSMRQQYFTFTYYCHLNGASLAQKFIATIGVRAIFGQGGW